MNKPPEFISYISKIILLSPEEIRLSKRNTENIILIESLDNILKLLLNSNLIEDSLRNMGYIRNWTLSVRERLFAITWIVIMTNLNGRKLISNLYEKMFEYPNILTLWYQHIFPLIPRSIQNRQQQQQYEYQKYDRDSTIQGYGRIIHKLKLLKDLEQCRLKLMKKIIDKFNEIKINQEKEGLKININDEDFLSVCLGLILPEVSNGSKQEGSLRILRNEIKKIEESIIFMNESQIYMEKYLNWLGLPEINNETININLQLNSNIELNIDLNSNSDEILLLNNELLECTDMLASLECILPNILIHGNLPIHDIQQMNHSDNYINENMNLNIQRLCNIADQNLLQINNNLNNNNLYDDDNNDDNDHNKDNDDKLNEMKQNNHESIKIETPISELSYHQMNNLPYKVQDEIHFDLTMSSILNITNSLENNYDMEINLTSLRNSHSELLERTKNITKKYSPYEFVSLYEKGISKG